MKLTKIIFRVLEIACDVGLVALIAALIITKGILTNFGIILLGSGILFTLICVFVQKVIEDKEKKLQ